MVVAPVVSVATIVATFLKDKAKLEELLAQVQQELVGLKQQVQRVGAGSGAAAAAGAPVNLHSITETLKARSSVIIYCEGGEAEQLMGLTELEGSADISVRAMACLSVASNILETKCPLVLPGSNRSAVEVQAAFRMRLRVPRPVPPIVAQLASPAQAEQYLQFSRSPGGKAALAQFGVTVRPWLTSAEKQQKNIIMSSGAWLAAVDAAKSAGHPMRWEGAVPYVNGQRWVAPAGPPGPRAAGGMQQGGDAVRAGRLPADLPGLVAGAGGAVMVGA
eukprot:GHUV01001692.1.p2 GENE.GHUV01001692.1~~GHUV01001692.1.p2  ORF type:complete len:276 (+),score=89.66 GHUV01001692.1:601-1428(+)